MLQILNNDENVKFRIKGNNPVNIKNDKLQYNIYHH